MYWSESATDQYTKPVDCSMSYTVVRLDRCGHAGVLTPASIDPRWVEWVEYHTLTMLTDYLRKTGANISRSFLSVSSSTQTVVNFYQHHAASCVADYVLDFVCLSVCNEVL